MESPFFFQTKDSSFYFKTAILFTIVPFVVFLFSGESIYLLLEMNYNFFEANGFSQDKSVFFDLLLSNTLNYALGALTFLIFSFFLGLYLTYLNMLPFDKIEDYALSLLDSKENFEANVEIKVNNKILSKSTKLLFEYLYYLQHNHTQSPAVPNELEKHKHSKIDKWFFTQYSIFVGVSLSIQFAILNSFHHSLNKEIITRGLSQLVTSPASSSFLSSQVELFNIAAFSSILFGFALYFVLGLKLHYYINGVTYGLNRDIVKIVKGDHTLRLSPRLYDPAQEMSLTLNHLLDNYLIEKKQNYSVKLLSVSELNFESIDNSFRNYDKTADIESEVVKMLIKGEKKSS